MSDPFALPGIFVLPRDTDFALLRRIMADTGFAEIGIGVQARLLTDDMPDFFAWAWPGGIPQISYRFNRAARLALLDLAEAPPALRALLAQQLQPLDRAALLHLLQGDDDRDRLFALYAARETGRLDLIHDIGVVAQSLRGLLRDEADAVLLRLGDMAQARLEMVATARIVASLAMDVIGLLRDQGQVMAHLIRPEDCASLFAPRFAKDLAGWLEGDALPCRIADATPESVEDVAAVPAGMFRDNDMIVRRFPNGYRQIAGWMQPSRVWIAWQGRQPDGGRVLMDGLVFTGQRWVWFPKPFRALLPLLPVFPQPQTAPVR